ncbi:MucBP domain-containing protein [Streptococcus sp. ZJ151]|uniref:LPXTG cell wall anchor domain-containing protein n=1 Tax=Streptococcus jiangjianxini TaxID=3161189 RepID=UPI0032EE12C5
MQKNRSKGEFYQMERREIFSIRKFKLGVASALIGVSLFGGHAVLAQEATSDTAQVSQATQDSAETEQVTQKTPVETDNAALANTPAAGNTPAPTSEPTAPQDATPATETEPEKQPVITEASSEEQDAAKTQATCCETVTKYEIKEDPTKDFGYAENTTKEGATTGTIALGVKPKVVEDDNTIRTTRYEAGSLSYDKNAYEKYTTGESNVAPNHVVENLDGLNKIAKGQYTDLIKAYETVEAKEIRTIEDTLQVQQFGEEGVIDLNKVLDWMAKQNNEPVMTEFKFAGSDGHESYLALFKGSDGRNWVSTNKSEEVVTSVIYQEEPVTVTGSDVPPNHSHIRDANGDRAWQELTHAQLAKSPSTLGGLYNVVNSASPEGRRLRAGTPLLTVINDTHNVENRQGDNKAYLYNHNTTTDVTYMVSYRTATKMANDTRMASPFPDYSGQNVTYPKTAWVPFNKSITLKPHVGYYPEVTNLRLGIGGNLTDSDHAMIAGNEYRRAVLVDIKPTTERVTVDGKEHYKYTEYGLNQKTGEKVVISETLVPVDEVPADQMQTTFVSEGVALTLPKLQDGKVVLTNKALLKVIYDQNYNINKQSILQDYYGVYDARRLADNPDGYDALFTEEGVTRRATEMDDRKATYNINHRPYRNDVRREILAEVADKKAPFHRNVTITPNVTVNHYLEDGTLLKTETKAATDTLDPYFREGSPEFLKDYTYVRSDIDEQEYIYKKVENPQYYTEGFNLGSVTQSRYESMGTVAPPFFSSTDGRNAGFALTYDNYAIVEAVSHERAQEVRDGLDPEYCVAEEARHIRTINVYYKEIPHTNEVPNDYPTVDKPTAELTTKKVEGNVIVHYVDENGKVIKSNQELPTKEVRTETYIDGELAESVPTGETYDATTPELKPDEIPFEGDNYRFIRVHEESEPVQGDYIEGTRHVVYVYKLKTSEVPNDYPTVDKPTAELTTRKVEGNVIVHYVDENGKVIKSNQELPTKEVRTETYIDGELAQTVPTGETYDTTTPELKPDEIPFEGNNYRFIRVHEESEPVQGDYIEGTRHVVYVYKLKTSEVPNDYPTVDKPTAELTTKKVEGNVVVHYVDENGKVIKSNQELPTKEVRTETYIDGELAESVPTGETYDTTTSELKPDEIPFEGDNYRFIRVHEESEPVQGDYIEGTRHIVYVYKLKTSEVPNDYPTVDKPTAELTTKKVEGNVIVHYVDENGKVIKSNQELPTKEVRTETYIDGELAESVPTGETYDATTPELKPNEIPFEGDNYRFIRVHEESEPVQGEYIEGTRHVVYVYKLKTSEVPNDYPTVDKPTAELTTKKVEGNVVVHYVDENGKVIKSNQELPTKEVRTETYIDGELAQTVPTGETYDTTTPELKPDEIPFEGDNYRFIRVHEESEPVQGDYIEGTRHVVYVYKLKTSEVPNDYPTVDKPTAELTSKQVEGNVVVHYVDEEGNVIASDNVKDKKVVTTKTYINGQLVEESDTHEPYNVDNETDKPSIIVFNGKSYELVRVHPNSEPVEGELREGTIHVTYVYRLLTAPEDPEKPGVPEEPEIPETPETPDTPEVPNTPEEPEVPEVPETPETPETPDTPEVPNTPEEPEVPEIPETPEMPETPDTPDMPDTPNVPKISESPVTPIASTRRNGSDKYMAKGVENLPNTGETNNYPATIYGGMAIGLAALLASKKRKRDGKN